MLAVMALVPAFASADISFVDFKVNPATTTPSSSVVAELTVDRQPNAVTNLNDWQSYRVSYNGTSTCQNVNFTVGASVDTATTTITASSTDSVGTVEARIYRNPGCWNERDLATTTLAVVTPPPPPAPAPAPAPQVSHRGGDRPMYCSATRLSFCKWPDGTFGDGTWHGVGAPNPSVGGSAAANLELRISIIKQLIPLYTKLIELLGGGFVGGGKG